MKKFKGEISVSEFKKHCLSIMEAVYQNHSSFVITKRGKPIAEVKPLLNKEKEFKSAYGLLKGCMTEKGDIVNFSSSDDWKAMKDDYEFPDGVSE